MTMSEFADYYRQKDLYRTRMCTMEGYSVWSDKQLFWYCDPFFRACVNMDQGSDC